MKGNLHRFAVGVCAQKFNLCSFVRFVCACQEHARTILPHLTALAGNEGADAWIGETMEIFNAATGRQIGEASFADRPGGVVSHVSPPRWTSGPLCEALELVIRLTHQRALP